MSSAPHPPWYRIYPPWTPITFLRSITVRIAELARLRAAASSAVLHQQDPSELFRFEDVAPVSISVDAADDGSDEESVASDTSLSNHLRNHDLVPARKMRTSSSRTTKTKTMCKKPESRNNQPVAEIVNETDENDEQDEDEEDEDEEDEEKVYEDDDDNNNKDGYEGVLKKNTPQSTHRRDRG